MDAGRGLLAVYPCDPAVSRQSEVNILDLERLPKAQDYLAFEDLASRFVFVAAQDDKVVLETG